MTMRLYPKKFKLWEKAQDQKNSSFRILKEMRIQRGISLIELFMVIALSSGLLFAAIAFLLTIKQAYIQQTEAFELQQSGVLALHLITRAIRQAGYENWDSEAGDTLLWQPSEPPYLEGRDNCATDSTTSSLCAAHINPINHSDVLKTNFYGAGMPKADETLFDCSGRAIAGPNKNNRLNQRGYSIFYIGKGSSLEPELYCKHQTANATWRIQPLIRGVENLQFLYGLDTTNDGIPNQFFPAQQIQHQHWCRVVAIKVALIMRGTQYALNQENQATFYLFGKNYQNPADLGTVFQPKTELNLPRRLFSTTIALRNIHYLQEPDLCPY